MYTINWTKKASKQLQKLDRQFVPVIFAATRTLENFPNCKDVKALKEHQYGYRLRVGNFRVLFDVHTQVTVIEIQEVKKRDERTY